MGKSLVVMLIISDKMYLFLFIKLLVWIGGVMVRNIKI